MDFDSLMASTASIFLSTFGDEEQAELSPLNRATLPVSVIFNNPGETVDIAGGVYMTSPSVVLATADAAEAVRGSRIKRKGVYYYVIGKPLEDAGLTLLELSEDAPHG